MGNNRQIDIKKKYIHIFKIVLFIKGWDEADNYKGIKLLVAFGFCEVYLTLI